MSIPHALSSSRPTETDAVSVPFSLSVLTATHGHASKQLGVSPEGLPVKGEGSLAITAGHIAHYQVAGLGGLRDLLQRIQPTQALVHGVITHSRPGDVFALTTLQQLPHAPAGTVTRSLNHLQYPQGHYLLMWDRDPDSADPSQLTTAAELMARLAQVLPGVDTAGRLVTTSTSSGIRWKATDAWIWPRSGMHVYQLVQGNLARFRELVKARLWNADMGYCKLASPNRQTGVAAVLERALVDLSVFSAERLDYVAGARIAPEAPFYQDRGAPVVVPGPVLDLDAFPDLTTAERQAYATHLADRKAALAPARFSLVKATVQADAPGLSDAACESLARQQLDAADQCWLPPTFLLFFAHRQQAVSVTDLTQAYDGWRLADPLEPTYRDGTDAVFHWRQGDWRIVSFAHGIKRVYRLEPSAPARDQTDPQPYAGVLAHRMPDYLRDHPDPRVRQRWTRIYRRANSLKQRYVRAGVVPWTNQQSPL